MTAFLQRALATACAALLFAVLALAFSEGEGGKEASRLPRPAVGLDGEWYPAVAGLAPLPPARGRAGDCGFLLLPRTLGVLHPVLPCGAKLFLAYRGKTALTRVVAHRPVAAEHDLDLTPALAALLDLRGVDEVRWVFARD